MAIHSIAQELVMMRGCTLERAEEKVSMMQDRVIENDDDPIEVLEDEGLSIHNAWIAELKGDY